VSYMSRADAYMAKGDQAKAADDYKKVAHSSGDAPLKRLAEKHLAEIVAKK